MFIKNNDNNKKYCIHYWVTLLALICIILVSLRYYYMHTVINDGKLSDLNNGGIVYQVEKTLLNDSILKISGWCFYLNDDLSSENKHPNMRVILIPTDDYEEFYYYSVRAGIARTEVDAYYQEEHSTIYCGFDAEIDLNNLDFESHNYEIVLQPDDRKENIIRPGLFIFHGKISPVDGDFNPPNVAGTDLEEIVKNGILRVYCFDLGIYIYQYNWKLFFIADERYPFDKEWTTYGFNVYTNHPELMSENQQDYGKALGWNLLKYEITDLIDAGIYRVSVREIPDTYPVKYIDTGYWTSEKGWVTQYRICPGILDK